MNWKKLIIGVIILILLLRVVFILDVYINEGKHLKLEKVDEEIFKANLCLRNFYIYTFPDELNAKNYSVTKFPEFTFSDGLNYGKNIDGLSSWQSDESDKLGLNSNSIVIPYDWNIFPFLILGQINEKIVFDVQINDKGEPISIRYNFLNDSENAD